jgi:hypothetical protein
MAMMTDSRQNDGAETGFPPAAKTTTGRRHLCSFKGCPEAVFGQFCDNHRPTRYYRPADVRQCAYKNCKKAAWSEFCHNHTPEAFARRARWIAALRDKKRLESARLLLADERAHWACTKCQASEVSWRSEYDPETSEVSGWVTSCEDHAPAKGECLIDAQHAPPMIDIDNIASEED